MSDYLMLLSAYTAEQVERAALVIMRRDKFFPAPSAFVHEIEHETPTGSVCWGKALPAWTGDEAEFVPPPEDLELPWKRETAEEVTPVA